jgi:hypothetical protein
MLTPDRLLLIAALLASPVAAQSLHDIPKSEPLMDGKGKVVGTATVSGNRTYFRDADGKLLYTMEKTAQGMAMYDADGKKVDFKIGDPAKESRH